MLAIAAAVGTYLWATSGKTEIEMQSDDSRAIYEQEQKQETPQINVPIEECTYPQKCY